MRKHQYVPPIRREQPGEHESRLLDRAPGRDLSKAELKRRQRMHERIGEAMNYAKRGEIQWANGEYTSLYREAMGMDYNDNLLSHLEELKAEIDGALRKEEEKNQELKKVNEIWKTLDEARGYAEKGDFESVMKTLNSARGYEEIIKRNPDLRLEYERLRHDADFLIGQMLTNSPEIEIIDVKEKEMGEDGMREKGPVFYVNPNKEYFDKEDKDDKEDSDKKPDYESWDEIQDDSI